MANDPGSEQGAAVLEMEESQKRLVDILTDLEQQKLEARRLRLEIEQLGPEVKNREELHKQNQELLKALNILQRVANRMLRSEKKYDINRISISHRYFKRASNQLIKALRQL